MTLSKSGHHEVSPSAGHTLGHADHPRCGGQGGQVRGAKGFSPHPDSPKGFYVFCGGQRPAEGTNTKAASVRVKLKSRRPDKLTPRRKAPLRSGEAPPGDPHPSLILPGPIYAPHCHPPSLPHVGTTSLHPATPPPHRPTFHAPLARPTHPHYPPSCLRGRNCVEQLWRPSCVALRPTRSCQPVGLLRSRFSGWRPIGILAGGVAKPGVWRPPQRPSNQGLAVGRRGPGRDMEGHRSSTPPATRPTPQQASGSVMAPVAITTMITTSTKVTTSTTITTIITTATITAAVTSLALNFPHKPSLPLPLMKYLQDKGVASRARDCS
ncbi:hypothetical protein E2C01_030634 [Portunus trituberculatus]|uniref:Uncharacterized protein n=1 Tax=Portunus trituberculatus TaxID=210409 RepID=A0A5B7EVD1_PORTR|nr:hypothetical protein [Portunus trituberculatus]